MPQGQVSQGQVSQGQGSRGHARHILVAGAGIGGLTAGLALARRGFAVSILERASVLEDIGAGLQLSPNATRILRDLGLLDAVAAIASKPTGIRVRSARGGATLSVLPLIEAEARWGAPYLVAHRADLQSVLLAAAEAEPGIALHRGTALAGFGVRDGRVMATAKQGPLTRAFDGDALIGADGIRSMVRAKLAEGDDPHQETGRTAWRSIVDAEAVPALFSNGETGLWLGAEAHLVHYPLRGGRHVNVVAVTRDATRLDGAQPWAGPGDPAVIASRFARWHGTARALIAAAPRWTTWPLFDRKPLPAWSAGPIALLGDAAHPILPFLAQGAAQAIEDAAALAAALDAGPDVATALLAYSSGRQARAARVQAAARHLGADLSHGGAAGPRARHRHAFDWTRWPDGALRLALRRITRVRDDRPRWA